MPITHPAQPDFASAAEQTVWDHLSAQLPDDAVLIAGQRLTREARRSRRIFWCCGRASAWR